MPRTIEKTVFAFDELSDHAKDFAREWWRSCESQDFDSECIFDDAVECGKLIGIARSALERDWSKRSIGLFGEDDIEFRVCA